MKERTKELKATARSDKKKADGEADVLAKIEEMEGTDRTIAKRLHAMIRASAPDLTPRTWYGMPAYAKDGEVKVCDLRLQRHGEPRRGRYVADLVRTEEVDSDRRGEDRETGEEGGELRSDADVSAAYCRQS